MDGCRFANHFGRGVMPDLPATLKEGCGHMHFSLDQATDLIRSTLVIALIVSTPMLAIGLIVGVIVSLLQAVTQIQEQTLTFVPKIVAMVAAVILLFPWMGQYLLDYAAQMFGSM
jgi:flagellar biosynthetic protein FliQ